MIFKGVKKSPADKNLQGILTYTEKLLEGVKILVSMESKSF